MISSLEAISRDYKQKQKQKQKSTPKKTNFWLNFFLNKECPKHLCGLDIVHRMRQTIPMWNIFAGGGGGGVGTNSSGHHCMSGVCGIEHYVMTL